MPRSTSSRSDRPLPTRQQRSRVTLDRLLGAAEAALRELGPDGATLREIADRAGVSLGIVYRRFPDKDAILRAVYLRFFQDASDANVRALEALAVGSTSLRQLLERIVKGMAEGYAQHRPLLRALVLYARTHQDSEFRRRTQAVDDAALEKTVALVLPHFPAAERRRKTEALRFGLYSVAAVLQETVLFDAPAGVNRRAITAEASRMLIRYLGVGGAAR